MVLDKGISYEKAMQFRAGIGDCKGRWLMDDMRTRHLGRPRDVLFDYKDGKFSEDWRPLNILELNPKPFWNAKVRRTR